MVDNLSNVPEIDVIIPVFNPPDNWTEGILSNIRELSVRLACQIRPIVVCDGGLKKTGNTDSLEQISATVVRYETNKGKGHALRAGLRESNAPLVIYTDVDFPYTTESFEAILLSLGNGVDVAAGIRSDAYYRHVPKLRRVVSKMLRRMIRTIVRIPIDDTQCGLKGFNATGRAVFLETRIDRFLFDLEFIKLSAKKGLSITGVPVHLKEGVSFSKTRLTILVKESLNFLRILFR